MGRLISYNPNPVPADGSITTAKLGGDVTALAKDLLTQSTTVAAKSTLDVVDGDSGRSVVPFTF